MWSVGEIFLYLSFSGNYSGFDQTPPRVWPSNGTHIKQDIHSSSLSGSSEDDMFPKEEKVSAQTIASRFVQFFRGKTGETVADEVIMPAEVTPELELHKDYPDRSSRPTFDEAMKIMESKDQGREVPNNLPGVLVDQHYLITPSELNSIIFAPSSKFMSALAEQQKTTDVLEGPWMFENGGDDLKRVVSYTKAATKLVKAVKATEEQTYLKADGKNFAVLVSVSTPDVPYGTHFRCELLFSMMLGPELPSGDQTTQLVVSWRINFLQSTIMKGMIENGARQGLKDSYEQFVIVLSQHAKQVDLNELGTGKSETLSSLQMEQQSDWKLAVCYFGNITVFSALFLGIYMLAHIMLATPSTAQGLEFSGLDLPDSVGEVIVCGIFVLQAKSVLDMIARFMQARIQRGKSMP